MEKFKDFIYETSDIIFGFVVLLILILIFAYQLQDFFHLEMTSTLHAPSSKSAETMPTKPKEKLPTPTLPKETTESEVIRSSAPPESLSITIEVGSTPKDIANLLYINDAITSKPEFMKRISEQNLQTKLKAGTFEIPKSSSLDEVIRIITE